MKPRERVFDTHQNIFESQYSMKCSHIDIYILFTEVVLCHLNTNCRN